MARAKWIEVTLLAGVCGTGAAAAGWSAAGCTTHACEGDVVDLHDPVTDAPTVGHLIDDNTWESNTIADPWLDFQPERLFVLHAPQLGGRELIETEAYVSVDQLPNNSNWTTGSGNIAEFANDHISSGGDYIFLKNDTCAHYFVRVILRVAPAKPGADAGADADASDAGTDAPSDAPVDAPGQ